MAAIVGTAVLLPHHSICILVRSHLYPWLTDYCGDCICDDLNRGLRWELCCRSAVLWNKAGCRLMLLPQEVKGNQIKGDQRTTEQNEVNCFEEFY